MFRGAHETLHVFDGASGATPPGELVIAPDGRLYGTTSAGFGTVFRVTTAGEHEVVHAFDGASGGYPEAGLALDGRGGLVGTTSSGGPGAGGVVFRLRLAERPPCHRRGGGR